MRSMLPILLLVAAIAVGGGFGDSPGAPKNTRGGNMGLFPFPRVGRAGPSSWAYDPADVHVEMKKQGLMAFPRVGRSRMILDPLLAEWAKRSGNSAVWFGPRLGRVHKRSPDFPSWAYLPLPETLPALRQTDFTPRLGRESDEDLSPDEDQQPQVWASAPRPRQ